MRTPTYGLVGLMVISALGSVAADAAVLCATRKGAVKLRETCRARETAVDAAAVGLQGPQGPPGAKGDRGEPGPSAHTFADSGTDGITLGPDDVVVTSTAEQLPNASGAVGGPLTVPGRVRFSIVAAVRVRTEGTGAYECALQTSANDNVFGDVDRVATSDAILRFGVPSGTFTNDGFTLQYRVVCRGDATRIVHDADLSVVVAYDPF